MVTIDIDDLEKYSFVKLQSLMLSLPLPYRVRLSSSNDGLHFDVPLLSVDDYRRRVYDDEIRIALDDFRRAHDFPICGLLWDCKEGKRAGSWCDIKNQSDIYNFINKISRNIV